MNRRMIILLLFSWVANACTEFEPHKPPPDQTLDGPLDGLTPSEALVHARGDAAFNGQVFTSLTGLGPIFVATSCGSCHAGDGKGHPFTTLTRFGQTDSTGNKYLAQGGPQLQNRAIPGYQPEEIPPGATYARFTPPANTGLGYLEVIPDADIIAMSDPNDIDGDGISGIPNFNSIPDFISPRSGAIEKNGKYLCRFGKKAAVYDLLQQTTNAYNQDIGIASTFVPSDVYSGHNIDPEVGEQTIRDVVFYLQTLRVPVPRGQNSADFIKGKDVFLMTGCDKCHRQQLTTGYSPMPLLSFKTVNPYTDLLLHDMGPGLDDGYTEGNAKTSEWRTPPLWGLGLSPKSQGGQFYLLHDGRARSIEEAILLHGGEATATVDRYSQLSNTDKDALIQFLKSL